MRNIGIALIMAGVAITALWLLHRCRNARARRRYEQEQRLYRRKFREGQRSCDAAFEERVHEDKPEDAEDAAESKINLNCKNTALAPVFAKTLGVVL